MMAEDEKMREFEGKDGMMYIGGVPVGDIADEFGTPVYVTDEARLRENYRNIRDAFSRYMDTRIHYACKANTSLAVLNALRQEGSGIDAVSVGEVMTCLRAGFLPKDIMYTGVNVSTEELKKVVETGVMINVDSRCELERLAEIDNTLPISFRVTPEVGSGHSDKVITGSKGAKFGIPKKEVEDTYARAVELGFDIKGIHAHIGSGGQDISPFEDEMAVLAKMVNGIEDRTGVKLEFIDIGGGVGVPYRPNETVMPLNELASCVTEIMEMETNVRTIVLEPGRFIIADAGVLLTRCNDIKDTGVKKYVGVDAGFNTLIRPAMYDSYHHVVVGNKFYRACTDRFDIAGPICETGDYLAHGRVLPDPHIGDILAVYDAGAYGYSMSSRYNSRPLCAEVMVNNGKAELIRERETMEDQWRHQIVPERLR